MKKLLVCPICRNALIKHDKTLKCENLHSFDIAKQGYVNLTVGSSKACGDDKDMCRSRHEFHNKDYYKCLSEKLADICFELKVKAVVDAGCGEGYYLRKIRDFYIANGIYPEALCGIDLAKEAVAIAARCEKNTAENERIEYSAAGIFDMPVADNTADCVLSVFAPVPDTETYRILNENGILIVVSPGKKHLEGLKKAIYDNVYDNEIARKEYEGFEVASVTAVEDTISVSGSDIHNLFHMTPYYWKTSEADSRKLDNYTEIVTKIEFIITIYKKI